MDLNITDAQYAALDEFIYDALHEAASEANNNGGERDFLARLKYSEAETAQALEGNVHDGEIDFDVTHDAADDTISNWDTQDLIDVLKENFGYSDESIIANLNG